MRAILLVLLASAAAACRTTGADRSGSAASDAAIMTLPRYLEGTAHGFPVMRDRAGVKLADGEFTQWLEGDRLHLHIRYDFAPDRWVEETSVIRQEPQLVQESWSWSEVRGGSLHRKFDVDFLAGTATAQKRHDGEMRRWTEKVEVEPGRAFAGAGWALAIRGLRDRLLQGEVIELQTVGFTPSPKSAKVEISHDGLEQVPMSGRSLAGDRFKIHPLIPWIAKPFVDVPDSHVWLTNPPPAAFLRFEGPFAEPDDAIVRVDLLPGEPSEAAFRAGR